MDLPGGHMHPKPDEVFFFNPKQMGLPKQGYDKANSVA